MNLNLVEFLSSFPLYEHERLLFLSLEDFLSTEFLIRPILVFSIQENTHDLHISKCRSILGRADRLKLYSAKLLDEMLSQHDDIQKIPSLEVLVESCHYYYLNLGNKSNQFYFAIFSSPTPIDKLVLNSLAKYSESHLKIIKQLEELKKEQQLIHIDDVTGLYNQRKMFKDLAYLVDKFNADKDPFCVLFVDLDYFKKVNDVYGHLIGTKLLEAVAQDIKGLLRDSDILYRYGGDEFVVILVGAEAGAGKLVGERILAKIRSQPYKFLQNESQCEMNLSVSIGVAEFPTDAKTSDEVLALADRMMYEAKECGRGVVFNTHDIFRQSLKKAVLKE